MNRRALRLLLFTALVLGVLYLAWLVATARRSPSGIAQANGLPLGGDFVLFYTAARELRAHGVEAVYDHARFHAAEQELAGTRFGATPWMYPPPVLLLVLPLGLLGYLPALVLWSAAGLGLDLWVLRRLAPLPLTPWWSLAFPGVLVALATGQASLYATALLGAGLGLLEARPRSAGVLLGVLGLKPQLGLAVGVALVAGRRGRALQGMAASLLALVGLSLLLFGPAPGEAWLESLPGPLEWTSGGRLNLYRIPTVFAGARLLGAPETAASALQGGVALAALGALAWLWARGAPWGLRVAALPLAIALSTPYLFDYDLALLGVTLAGLLRAGAAGEAPPPPPALLLGLWALPLAAGLLAAGTGIPIGPPILGASLAWVVAAAGRADATPP